MTDSMALRNWISSRGYKLQYIARQLGITPYTLQKKIDNNTEFKLSELAAFTGVLGMTNEERDAIFFAHKVECDSTEKGA